MRKRPPLTVSILLAFTLGPLFTASCQGLGGLDLSSVLAQITKYAGSISNWKSGLSGMLGDTQLGQLGDYAKQAGSLLESFQGVSSTAPDSAKETVSGIEGALSKLAGFDVNKLMGMSSAEKSAQVDSFGNTAGSLAELAKGLMSKLGG